MHTYRLYAGKMMVPPCEPSVHDVIGLHRLMNISLDTTNILNEMAYKICCIFFKCWLWRTRNYWPREFGAPLFKMETPYLKTATMYSNRALWKIFIILAIAFISKTVHKQLTALIYTKRCGFAPLVDVFVRRLTQIAFVNNMECSHL